MIANLFFAPVLDQRLGLVVRYHCREYCSLTRNDQSPMKRKQFVILAVLSLLLSLILKPGFATPSDTVEVQILAINDFHGNLEPPAGSSGQIQTANGPIDAGGAEYLATHINQLRETNPHTVVVSAGDLIGASPLLSALFHDEPTIEAFNREI